MRDPAVHELLALARHGTAPSAPLSERMVELLRRHGLAPLARTALRRAGRPEANVLQDEFLEAVGSHLRALAGLQELQVLLAGLPWVVLKGPVLSELAHPVPGTRPYGDLDLLVLPCLLGDVVDRLSARGWRLLDRNHRLVLARMPGEVHLLSPGGLQVDVHWHVVNAARRRRALRLSTSELLGRSVVRDLRGQSVRCLDDVDTLHHLCVHAAASGADRLLWLLDVHHWVIGRSLDWSDLARRARAAGTGAAVALVLGRASRVLATPVPARVVRELPGGTAWTRVDEAVSSLVGPAAGRSVPRAMARASRGGSAQSVIQLGRSALLSLRRVPSEGSAWQVAEHDVAWHQFLSRVAEEDGASQPC